MFNDIDDETVKALLDKVTAPEDALLDHINAIAIIKVMLLPDGGLWVQGGQRSTLLSLKQIEALTQRIVDSINQYFDTLAEDGSSTVH